MEFKHDFNLFFNGELSHLSIAAQAAKSAIRKSTGKPKAVPGPSSYDSRASHATMNTPVPTLSQVSSKSSEYDEEDDFKLSGLVMFGSAYPFFPYNTHTLKNFDRSQCLPDWRSLTIAVNVVNWIGDALNAKKCENDAELVIDCSAVLNGSHVVELPLSAKSKMSETNDCKFNFCVISA